MNRSALRTLISLPVAVGLIVLLTVVGLPCELLFHLREARKESRLLRRLKTAGRYIEWPDVEAHLKAGKGTLIFEDRGMHEVFRAWWTAEDVIAAAPLDLPQSWDEKSAIDTKAMIDFVTSTVDQYLKPDEGLAKITIVKNWDRSFSKDYPAAKVMVVVPWANAIFSRDSRVLARFCESGRR